MSRELIMDFAGLAQIRSLLEASAGEADRTSTAGVLSPRSAPPPAIPGSEYRAALTVLDHIEHGIQTLQDKADAAERTGRRQFGLGVLLSIPIGIVASYAAHLAGW
jgi:hypothetical protein